MSVTTIAVKAPPGGSSPWYEEPTIAKVTATFDGTTYNTANNVGIIVDFANLFLTSQSGTANLYGPLTQVLDQSWGLNTGDAMDIIAAIGTSANTWGLSLAGVKTVANQPTQRSLILAGANNGANAANGNTAGYIEITAASLTGTMDLFVMFAKGVRGYTNPGTGA